MGKITISRDEARAALFEDDDRFEIIEDNIVDNTRWSIIHDFVWQEVATGKFFSGTYSRGATEQQDESPFEYDDEVELTEVEQALQVVKVWRVV